ncbi:putative NUDIX hydrolase [Fusobacterium necrogenes]|uniref:Putative NUDIX hydrolase n=1 Tax=Fusobacterium necrogenes TaxID=858 RepID=A0A377GY56_9FUSO|nr:CoA pyrophosphatase [Fusobacterium necrogenes]STO31909.1 putative NUDIX hydrolase [Fusobacterium necrogenes]
MGDKLSEILAQGEKRIIGQNRYITSAVLIAIVEINAKEYIILEKRALHIRQGGEISFPGGKFDKEDITTEYTAIRETIEELGIAREKIKLKGKFGSLVSPNGIIIEVYVGYLNIKSIDELKYNIDEVEKVFLIPIKFFQNNNPRVEKIGLENRPLFSTSELKLPARYGNSWLGRAREVYFYNYQGETIWGLTAEIIYEFINLYGV